MQAAGSKGCKAPTSELCMRLPSMERLQCWVSRDLKLLTEVLRLGAVHLPNADLLVVLELVCQLAPDWSELFAVPTPGRIEFDEVHLSVIHLVVKNAHQMRLLNRKRSQYMETSETGHRLLPRCSSTQVDEQFNRCNEERAKPERAQVIQSCVKL